MIIISGTFREDIEIGKIYPDMPVNDPNANKCKATVRILEVATMEDWIAYNSIIFDPKWLRDEVSKMVVLKGKLPYFYKVEILD